MKHKQTQPARKSDRITVPTAEETIEFAHARDKRRRANKLARAVRNKNR